LIDVRFAALYGLNPGIALRPRSANNGSGGMFALSLRIAQPLARENAIFGGGPLSPLRFAERFQHFKDMIGKLSLSAFRPP
jgi:hypothetical protein